MREADSGQSPPEEDGGPEQQARGDDHRREEGRREPGAADRQRVDERFGEKEDAADPDTAADGRRGGVETAVVGVVDAGRVEPELVVAPAHSLR